MTGKEFAENALELLGQDYNAVDCIGVVRLSAHIKCQGTNWLWRSFNFSKKYRYLVKRSDVAPNINQLQDGLLVFRVNWNQIPSGYNDRPNCHHVGVIYGNDVIQSNSGKGVYRSKYNPNQWNACGELFDIQYDREFLSKNETNTDHENGELSDHEMIKRIYQYFFGID